MKTNITSFTDLIAWKKSHAFVLKIYTLVKTFPREEIYGLSDQMRRAAVSITSNIAEGFYRRTSEDKNHFYYNSLSSVGEIQNQLLIARDLHYIEKNSFQEIAVDSVEIHKLINSLIKSSSTKN